MHQKIFATGGLTLLLGLTTQAHAGEYVLQGGWTLISATASTSTATGAAGGGAPQSDSDTQETTLRWHWVPANPQDQQPTPVQIRLNFSATLGDCSTYGPEWLALASTDVYVGFANGGFSTPHFSNNHIHVGLERATQTKPGFTATASVTKPYNGAQIIFDTAKITASTSAFAAELGETATANATTGTLTSFSLENQ